MALSEIASLVRSLLTDLGEDVTRDGLQDTPQVRALRCAWSAPHAAVSGVHTFARIRLKVLVVAESCEGAHGRDGRLRF